MPESQRVAKTTFQLGRADGNDSKSNNKTANLINASASKRRRLSYQLPWICYYNIDPTEERVGSVNYYRQLRVLKAKKIAEQLSDESIMQCIKKKELSARLSEAIGVKVMQLLHSKCCVPFLLSRGDGANIWINCGNCHLVAFWLL